MSSLTNAPDPLYIIKGFRSKTSPLVLGVEIIKWLDTFAEVVERKVQYSSVQVREGEVEYTALVEVYYQQQ